MAEGGCRQAWGGHGGRRGGAGGRKAGACGGQMVTWVRAVIFCGSELSGSVVV